MFGEFVPVRVVDLDALVGGIDFHVAEGEADFFAEQDRQQRRVTR